MSATNHAKLGFFLVLAFAVTCGFTVYFLQQLRDRPALYGVTYFDEAIGGLRADSPVRYRGVDIGRVQNVALDFDTTYIRVEFEVWIDALPEWESQALQQNVKDIDPLLRAQIATVGLIGQSFLQVDRLDNPPSPLRIDNIPAGRHYLPSRHSDMTSLVRNMRSSLQRMPSILERLESTLITVERQIAAVQLDSLAQQAETTLAEGTQTLQRVNKALDRYTAEGGPADSLLTSSTQFIEEARRQITTGSSLHTALNRVDSLGQRIENILADDSAVMNVINDAGGFLQPDGKLAQLTQQVSQTLLQFDVENFQANLERLMHQVTLLSHETRNLLPDLQISIAQIRQLLRSIQEEPEQLIFGPRDHEGISP